MQKIREQLLLRIMPTFNKDEAEFILDQLDMVLSNYDIREKETLPATTDDTAWFEKYFRYKTLEGMSKTTVKGYKSIFKDFCIHKDKPLLKITTNDIRNFLIAIKEERDLSDESINQRRNALSGFYK